MDRRLEILLEKKDKKSFESSSEDLDGYIGVGFLCSRVLTVFQSLGVLDAVEIVFA